MSIPRTGKLTDPVVLLDLVSQIAEGIYITNARGEILDANPAFLRMFGFPSVQALRTCNVADLVDPEQREQEMKLLMRDGFVRDYELQMRRPDGEIRTVLDTAYSSTDPVTGELVYRGILHDITLRKRLENQLIEQSIRDPLTGCYNRRHLVEFERQMGGQPWGCIVVDIDNFKSYNDSFGHLAGDEVLIRLTRFLMRNLRAAATVARMGGDEFLILLPNTNETETATTANRIAEAAARENPAQFSMGYAAREFKESLERTIHRADQNLYEVRTTQRPPEEERRKQS